MKKRTQRVPVANLYGIISLAFRFNNMKINININIILPVFYVCEALVVTLREEHRLGVFRDRSHLQGSSRLLGLLNPPR
jgi:hypothetical protein